MFDYGKNAFVADDNENCRSEWTNSKNSTDNLMVGRRYNDNYMFFKALWWTQFRRSIVAYTSLAFYWRYLVRFVYF